MKRCYFTLVELLTVIAVIAILAGIAIPVVIGMQSKGKETSARADMNAIKMALTQFKADYSIWPVAASSSDTRLKAAFKSDDTETDDGAIDSMVSELTTFAAAPDASNAPAAATMTYNTRKRKYLDAPAKPVTPVFPVSSVTSGFMKLDPWGRRYNIALDTNYDKKLELTTAFLGTGSTAETIVGDIAVYSYGTAEGVDDLDAFLYSWKTNEK
ncbi:MAG: prepilin-type N-terminal cleavage/methylation domain-containing protein [Lentisphaeria bacterium]|nr:prepilin-type N-terminal cleavage/methylation domain-containing protein [Lentisphaeria bacterium]